MVPPVRVVNVPRRVVEDQSAHALHHARLDASLLLVPGLRGGRHDAVEGVSGRFFEDYSLRTSGVRPFFSTAKSGKTGNFVYFSLQNLRNSSFEYAGETRGFSGGSLYFPPHFIDQFYKKGPSNFTKMEEQQGEGAPAARLRRRRSRESPTTRREKDRLRKKKARERTRVALQRHELSESSEDDSNVLQEEEEEENREPLEVGEELFALASLRTRETRGRNQEEHARNPPDSHQPTTSHGGPGQNGNGADTANGPSTPENTLQEEGGNTGETPCFPQRPTRTVSDAERVALAIASIKGCSRVSDRAITKILTEIVHNLDTFRDLIHTGTIRPDYTHSLRPLALRHIPKVRTNLYLEEKMADHYVHYYIRGLEAIPARYCNLPPSGALQVLREESYVRLEDIRKHHEYTHIPLGYSMDKIQQDYRNCILSMDGVEEAKNGKTTFEIVSIKIGQCVYLYWIFNPLVGYEAAKPSPESMLRYFLVTE